MTDTCDNKHFHMTVTVNWETKLRITVLNAEGKPEEQIALELGVSVRTVQRVKHRFRKHGDVEGGRRKPGRKSIMDPGMENVCLSFDIADLLVFDSNDYGSS